MPNPDDTQLEALLAEAPALLQYARLRLNDHQESEEVVQDTLLAAWNQRAEFQGRSSLRTWLIGILRHKLLDRLRARQRRPDRPQHAGCAQPEPGEEEGDPLETCFTPSGAWKIDPTFHMEALAHCPRDTTLRSELRELLRLCLAALPKRLAHLFRLREMDHLETKEAAQLAGVAENSAPVLLTRARLRLRDCLQQRLSTP